jgi:peptide-methionine (S)-S-oxide reductase
MALTTMFGLACERPTHAADDLPKPAIDIATKDSGDQKAVFAGGCFWCTEAVFEQLKGVKDVVSGYAGGTKESADYETVSSGRTGHAESIQITYDPSKISYGELLRVFFTTHNPTTKDAQGPDHGHQYRSAIFYANEDQKKVAEAYIKQLTEAKAFDKPIVTTLEPLKAFYPAEDYHQDFVKRNPNQGYVQRFALPKVQKVIEHFKDEVKKGDEKK